MALEANRLLVDAPALSSADVAPAALLNAVQHWAHFVQLVPSTRALLWRLPGVTDVEECLECQPPLALEQVPATVILDRERRTVDVTLRRNWVEALEQQGAVAQGDVGQLKVILMRVHILAEHLELAAILLAVGHLLLAVLDRVERLHVLEWVRRRLQAQLRDRLPLLRDRHVWHASSGPTPNRACDLRRVDRLP
eukprot:5597037-Prymnesium_polylepis.1